MTGDLDQSDILFLYFADSTFLDLMEVFPMSQLKLFLMLFGGTTITVPSLQDIKNCGRDFRIFNYVSKRVKSGKKAVEAYREAADLFHCSIDFVTKIYKNLKQYEDRITKHQEVIKKLSIEDGEHNDGHKKV